MPAIKTSEARHDYELPVPKMIEAPMEEVNYPHLHAAALEEIDRLNAELEGFRKKPKTVSLISGPLGTVCLDDAGQMFERMNDNQPRGPGPVAKVWVRIAGPHD